MNSFYSIHGGKRLEGTVTISGAKNAAVAIIPAAILAGEPCVLENLPNIADDNQKLVAIPGELPDLTNELPGCTFHPRCSHACERCRVEEPVLKEVSPGHLVRCHLVEGKEVSYGTE